MRNECSLREDPRAALVASATHVIGDVLSRTDRSTIVLSLVGPNRSVLILSGSYFSDTSSLAARSTNAVGPQTYASGRSLAGHAISRSMSPSMRRWYPVHSGGHSRVSV